MIGTSLGVATALLLGLLGAIVWTLRGLLEAQQEIARHRRSQDFGELLGIVGAFEGRLKGVEEDIDRLPSKWEDVKREARSLYQRARHHVRRANEELEARGLADGELQDLDAQLHEVDGAGSPEQGMLPLSESMGGAAEANGLAPQPDPTDWRHATLRRKYG